MREQVWRSTGDSRVYTERHPERDIFADIGRSPHRGKAKLYRDGHCLVYRSQAGASSACTRKHVYHTINKTETSEWRFKMIDFVVDFVVEIVVGIAEIFLDLLIDPLINRFSEKRTQQKRKKSAII